MVGRGEKKEGGGGVGGPVIGVCVCFGMKVVDMERHVIVDSGQTWPHEKKPCSRDMLPFLEQNESVVTWIAPKGSSCISHQIPVIRVKKRYYSVSLRMMKAIWRHVRLSSDFRNVDTSKDGRSRLKIPVKLYSEKKRTQQRFNVSLCPPSS